MANVKNRFNKKYSKEQIDQAREMYLDYKSHDEISDVTGINKNTLAQYIRKNNWGLEREEKSLEIERLLDTSSNATISNILKNGLDALDIAMHNVLKRASELDIVQMVALQKAISGLHKVKQLEKGKATAISKVENDEKEEPIEVFNPLIDKDTEEIVLELPTFDEEL